MSHRKIKVYLTLTFDPKVIALIYNFCCCNLHTIGNHYVRYEYPLSKERSLRHVLSKCELDLLLIVICCK